MKISAKILDRLTGADKTYEERNTLFDEMKSFRAVGETFRHCGLEFTVMGYGSLSHMGAFLPAINADYVDHNGVLRSATFYGRDLDTLKKQNG